MNLPLLVRFVLSATILLTGCGRRTFSDAESKTGAPPVEETRTLDGVRVEVQGLDPAKSRLEANATKRAAGPAPLDLEPSGLPAPRVEDLPPADYPPHGSALTAEDAHRLLSGKVIFNPNQIASSDIPVEADTPLFLGQELQVKYGGTWWAGSVLGFEKDGRVRVHYFGWADSWDEPKSRAELQLDPDVLVRALDSTYTRNGW